MNLLTDNLGCGTVYRVKTTFHQILTDRKERFGMSTEKKPTATVKASFISTKTEDTKVPAKKEEKKVVKKAEKKAVPAVKAEEKKAVPAVKAEEKKAVPAVKAEEKKAVPAAKAEKKASAAKAEKKAPAAKAEKKAPAVKAEKKAPAAAEVVLQWNGNDYTYDRLLQSAKDVWQYDQGKNVADFKKAVIYVKPEEGKAYVVVNDTDELSFDI